MLEAGDEGDEGDTMERAPAGLRHKHPHARLTDAHATTSRWNQCMGVSGVERAPFVPFFPS